MGMALLNSVAASAAAGYLASHVRRLGAAEALRLAPAAAVHGYVTAFEVSAAMVVAAFVVTGLLLGRHGGREAGAVPIRSAELEEPAEAA